MSGPTITPEQYRKISDWDLLHVYLHAVRDDDGIYIPIGQRIKQSAGYFESDGEEDSEPAKDPIAALGVPREALFLGVPVQYAVMFFNVYRNRGMKDDGEILKLLQAKIREVPPWGCYSQG